MDTAKPLELALKLQRLSQQVVIEALQVERAQGDSWKTIADRVHLSRSAAAGRWKRHSFSPKTEEQLRKRLERSTEYLALLSKDLLELLQDARTTPQDLRDLKGRVDDLEARLDMLEQR